MSFGNILTLSSGAKLPQIGLGTWLSKPHEVEHAVEFAVRNGYRHLDLAMVYQNQDEVGRALTKVIPSVVRREELFITSKLWNHSHRPELVEKELDETLSQLGLEYLDSYLIHWPIAFAPGRGLFPIDPNDKEQIEIDDSVTLADTWKAMIKLPKSKVKAIGVSNFSIDAIEGIIAETGVVPVVNQVEAHPLLPQDDLLQYCKSKGIHVTAYSPLGNNLANRPKLTDHPVVNEVANSLSATPAQVLVAWGVHRGYSVIPKSVQESRIISNFQQVKLSDEDYKKVTAIGENNHTRFNTPYTYESAPGWDFNTFNEPEEKTAKYQVRIR